MYGTVVYDMYTVPYNLNASGCGEIKNFIKNFSNLNSDGIIKIAEDYEKTDNIGETHGECHMNIKYCKTVAKEVQKIITKKIIFISHLKMCFNLNSWII